MVNTVVENFDTRPGVAKMIEIDTTDRLGVYNKSQFPYTRRHRQIKVSKLCMPTNFADAGGGT